MITEIRNVSKGSVVRRNDSLYLCLGNVRYGANGIALVNVDWGSAPIKAPAHEKVEVILQPGKLSQVILAVQTLAEVGRTR